MKKSNTLSDQRMKNSKSQSTVFPQSLIDLWQLLVCLCKNFGVIIEKNYYLGSLSSSLFFLKELQIYWNWEIICLPDRGLSLIYACSQCFIIGKKSREICYRKDCWHSSVISQCCNIERKLKVNDLLRCRHITVSAQNNVFLG